MSNENPMIQELIEMFEKLKKDYPLGYIVEAYKEVIGKELIWDAQQREH